MLKQNNIKFEDIKGMGKQGRITKEDVLNHLANLHKGNSFI